MIRKHIFLCIILNYKNLQFKQLIDVIVINLRFFWKTYKYEEYKNKM